MNFSPDKRVGAGGIVPEGVEPEHGIAGKIEKPENAMDAGRFEVPYKGLFALAAGAIWLEYKTLRDPFMDETPIGGELSEKDKKKVAEQGWLRTALEKAKGAYEIFEKIEDIANKQGKGGVLGGIEAILKKQPGGESESGK